MKACSVVVVRLWMARKGQLLLEEAVVLGVELVGHRQEVAEVEEQLEKKLLDEQEERLHPVLQEACRGLS